MIARRWLLAQSRQPSGLLGRLLVGRYLDRVNAGLNDLVYECLRARPGERLLEVGFGGGELLLRLAAALGNGRIAGVDPSAEMVAAVRRRARRRGIEDKIELYPGSVDALPFADAAFDGALSVHTIYFWPELQRGLDEVARVLKPGARLVLGFSCAEAMRDAGMPRHGYRPYTPRRVAAALEQAGISPQQTRQTARRGGGSMYALSGVKR